MRFSKGMELIYSIRNKPPKNFKLPRPDPEYKSQTQQIIGYSNHLLSFCNSKSVLYKGNKNNSTSV